MLARNFCSEPCAFVQVLAGSLASKSCPHPLHELALPVNLLDVIVHLGGQMMSTLQAATFEDFAATGCCHALPEAMDAHPATDFWLVCSFGHVIFFLTN
jgi:hypothetical protein